MQLMTFLVVGFQLGRSKLSILDTKILEFFHESCDSLGVAAFYLSIFSEPFFINVDQILRFLRSYGKKRSIVIGSILFGLSF